MSSIFLSHNHVDKPFVRRLAQDLQAAGVRVWIDEAEMLIGDSLIEKIRQGIDETEYLGVILSPNSVKSPWVQREVDVAMNQEIEGKRVKVLPLVIEDCELPGFLKGKLYADFRVSERYREEVEKVLRRLGKFLNEPQLFEPEMILIPAGEFLMGSDPQKDKNTRIEEQPQHTMHLPDYYLAKTQVTNAQYAAFIQESKHNQPPYWANGYPPPDQADYPVIYVSWYDAVAYCQWLSEVSAKSYRLPTETEWEKGARGTDGRIYPWGNQWDIARCNSREGGKNGITPVDAYPRGASPYDVQDMVGNVWEWTRSLWGTRVQQADWRYPYDPHDGREEVKAANMIHRVLRGGAFSRDMRDVRCARRFSNDPRNVPNNVGFRVVR